jgi:hypothetical protein
MYFYQIKCCYYTQNGCMNKKHITTVNSVTNTWSIQQTPMFHGCANGINRCNMFFVHAAVLSIITAFNLVKIHLLFRIMPLIQWSVMLCRPCFNRFRGLKYIPRLFNKKHITTVNSVTNTWSIQQTPMFHGCAITNKQNIEPWKRSTSWGHTKVYPVCFPNIC